MLLLLPPSETKRDGGVEGSSLDLSALAFASLTAPRKKALAALRTLSRSVAVSTTALGLGPTQRFEIERNRAISRSATMPAIERYTGVLYDAIDVESLDTEARRFLGRSVVIHSALFGLIGADDPVPAYRFSHDTRLPTSSLTRIWREANAGVLATRRELVIDLRSESYVHLGPASPESFFLRVVTDDGAGSRRALNHFNKHGKGELVRRIAESAREIETPDELIDWARSVGVRLEHGAPGELDLVV